MTAKPQLDTRAIKSLSFTNGFPSRELSATQSQVNARPHHYLDVGKTYPFATAFLPRDCSEFREQKRTLKYKKDLASDVIQSLRKSTQNDVLVLSDRIEECNSDRNLFIGSDMYTDDGECFTGKGTLWSCNSRLCPNCVGKLARANRKTIRAVMQSQKLLTDENWYSVTFTMPNLDLKGLELTDVADLFQIAWQRFTHREAGNKSKSWFQQHIRGGFKNCEFTFTENDVFNYHCHSLLIAKSKIKDNKFVEIRTAWTKALQFAFKKKDIRLQIRTCDELANVNVKKVTNREKTIKELCKYVTKSDSWSKLPLEQLEKVAVIPRFGRMFESFGTCRASAKEIRENALKSSANEKEATQPDTYLDTKKLIRRFSTQQPNPRRQSWRKRAKETSRFQCKIELLEEIQETIEFRKLQLQFRYPSAEFITLDDKPFQQPFQRYQSRLSQFL